MKSLPAKGLSRVLLSQLKPQVDGGRYPVKRIVDEPLSISACLVADGHDIVNGALAYRQKGKSWQHLMLEAMPNDIFQAVIHPEKAGFWEYKIEGWIDYALTWLHGLHKKHQDGQNVSVHLQDGKAHFEFLKKEKHPLGQQMLTALEQDETSALQLALSPETELAFKNHPEKKFKTESKTYSLWVDVEKAGFSAWYEFFPRSAAESGHGTFKDVEAQLPRVSKLGFDVLYLPPIHPVGEVNRKGKNNATTANGDDVGSPWGIGSQHGGHKSVHPTLGSLADYKKLIKTARKDYHIEIALDLAFQCAPDHPYVKEHPQWFKWRSDGTVQYAENPPKKYQDILPIYFETDDWQNLWQELLSVIQHWVDCGIRIFRVDNPHTKSINFWEWAIAEIHKNHPEIIFLAEAFTKPALMHQLAKAGFNQSYTYFTWRNFRHELIEYMQELTEGPGAEYFRPNFWPNTPDILPYSLQSGNESLYSIRLFLAATLSSNYGVYGPVYEHLVHEAIPGKEEYKDSEKYEVKHWDWDKENKITWLMQLVNKARKENAALQQTKNYRTLQLENQALYAYFKWQGDSKMLMVCSLDPYQAQEGWVQLPMDLITKKGQNLRLDDLASGKTYHWQDEWNYVRLEPAMPFHLFKVTE